MSFVKSALVIFLVFFVMPSAFALVAISDLGYHPSSAKTVTVYTSATSGTFSVVDTNNNVLKTGTLSQPKDYWGNTVMCQGNNPCLVGDFSDFTTQGTYRITTSLGETSRAFPINPLIYRNNAPLFNEFFDALSMANSSYHADMNKAVDPALPAMADGSFIMTSDQASKTLIRLGDAYRRNPVLLSSDKRTFVRAGTPDAVEHMMIYADYLAGLQDAKIQERTDGVGFRLSESMRIDYAFVPGPTSMTSMNVYDAGKNLIQGIEVRSLCSGSPDYNACIAKAQQVYKCQADEPCIQMTYNGKTATRIPGQTDGLGVDTGWHYEWSCFHDVNLQSGNYNDRVNPCLVYDASEGRENTSTALLAYVAVIPAINQYDSAKAKALLTRAAQTQTYIKTAYAPFGAGDQDAGYYGAANFLLYDLTGETKYLDEAYNLRGIISTQLVADGTRGNEFYWQEYARHKAAIEGAGKTYLLGGNDPVNFFYGKVYGDFKDMGARSISANGERVYRLDDNYEYPIAFQNSRFILTEGLFAAKSKDLFPAADPTMQRVADAQLAWITGNNAVDTDPGSARNLVSYSFIFGIGRFPDQYHSRLLMDSGYAALTGGAVPGMRGTNLMFHNGTDYVFLDGRSYVLGQELGAPGNRYRGEAPANQFVPKVFNNGKSYIPGWINGAYDSRYDNDQIFDYSDNRGAYEYTESTNEIVATAVSLFAYSDALYNNVAPLSVPYLGPANGTLPPGGGGGGGTVPPGNTTPPGTNTTPGCFNSVQSMPVSCAGGAFTQDTYDGCRHLTCASGASSMQVLACDKGGYFEMYKQGQAGSGISQICIGDTCIKDNGYAKSGQFPICTGNTTIPNTTQPPTNNTTQPPTNNTTQPPAGCFANVQALPVTCTGMISQDSYNGCRTVTCTNGGSSLQVLACDKPDGANPQYFEMYKQAATGAKLTVCLGNTCLSDQGYVKSQPYSCTNTTPPPTNPPPPPPTSGTVSVSVAPWYPQGRNYILVCNATGFTPTSYDWTFGDGDKLVNMDINNVYHSYRTSGSYTVSCTARNANTYQTGTLGVQVG